MSNYVQESKRGALALLLLLAVMATGLYCKGRELESSELTPGERLSRALSLHLEEWELDHPEEKKAGLGYALTPCEQRQKRNKFAYEFGHYQESPELSEKDRQRVAQRLYWYSLEYSRAALGYKRAGFKLECNDQPEFVLIEDAWVAHLSEEDEALFEKSYIEALREEIDGLRLSDLQSFVQPLPKSEATREIETLIANAYEKFGITREELGR
jgi:hypothetical protein